MAAGNNQHQPGALTIFPEDQDQLRRYLLGQLAEADEEKVELRLLSDRAFNEECDIVVDEIAIRYVAGGFAGKEKEQVEQYFLRAPERRNKVRVISELLRHSAATRSEVLAVLAPARVTPGADRGVFARFVRAWRTQPLMTGFATFAILIVVVGVAFLLRSGGPRPQTYAFSLPSTEIERGPGESTDAKSVKIPVGTTELHIQLQLSSPQTQPKSYRAEFVAPATPRDLPVVSQDAGSVVVAVPVTNLKPDRYAIRLFAISADGQEDRVPGSYIFRVE